jgi:hemin uptake protein HemP
MRQISGPPFYDIMNKTEDPDGGDVEHRSNPRGSPDVEGQRIVNSQDLLQGQKELWILHGDEMYRLRITASGKLYLTK